MRNLTAILIVALIGSSLPYPCAFAGPAHATTRVEDLANRYPGSRVYRVSPAEYRQIAPILRRRQARGELVVVQAAPPAPLDAAAAAVPNATQSVTNDAAASVTTAETNGVLPAVTNQMPAVVPTPAPQPRVAPPPPDTRHQTRHQTCDHACTGDCSGFFELMADLGSSDWSNSDAPLVIFVVIGVTVVVAVVVYAGAFLYELATGGGKYSYWWDVQVQTTALCGSGDQGYLAGLKLASGFENTDARVGFVLEGGYLDTRIRPDEAADRIDIVGGFVMAGASVRWPFGRSEMNPSFFGLELLAGTAEDEDVNLMSAARANLSFGIGAGTRLGFSLGALYLDLDPADGILGHIDKYTALVGVEAGFRF